MPFEVLGQLRISWLSSKYLDQVLRMEQESFYDPWSRRDFKKMLRWGYGIILTYKTGLLAYAVYTQPTDRKRKQPIRVENICVDRQVRRNGLATIMMGRLINVFSQQGIEAIVGERNKEGQMFWRSLGPHSVELLPNCFCDGSDGYKFSFPAVVPRMGHVSPLSA